MEISCTILARIAGAVNDGIAFLWSEDFLSRTIVGCVRGRDRAQNRLNYRTEIARRDSGTHRSGGVLGP